MYTSNLKLGKAPYKHDVRTLHFEDYLSALPQPPDDKIWYDKVKDFEMLGNDVAGNCVPVGGTHLFQMWTANVGQEQSWTLEQVFQIYTIFTGYDPVTGANDTGCVELDFLKYWKNVGFFGHKIGGFAAVNPRNIKMIKTAITLFGGLMNGLQLPKTIKGKTSWNIIGSFNGDAAPGSLGGHCTISAGYNPLQDINGSWGMYIPASWPFMTVYADERWVIFSPDFINNKGVSPSGFNREQLIYDLQLVSK